MKQNKIIFVGFFLLLFSMSGVFAFYNPSNNWQANQPTFQNLYSGDMSNFWPILTKMQNGQCNATSDFVISIPPGGCSPMVVRSDLLEQQNVPVFCKLYAIKVNPLIKVSSIRSISFSGNYPSGIRSVVFHPARAAVKSYTTLLGDPTINNIGYVVIILKQNKIEKNMSKWIAGNLTATIHYEADEAYGTGAGDYFLSEMSDNEWQTNYADSSFWNGRGYLRAKSINSDGATIQVLSSKNKVLRTFNLKEGATSSMLYFPGYYCNAGLKVRLNDLTVPEDKALLNVDGQTIWVRDGGEFLDGKCRVNDLDIKSSNEGSVAVRCTGVGKEINLALKKKGAIFKVDSNVGDYHTGEEVGEKYLIYYGSFISGGKSSVLAVLSNKKPSKDEMTKWRLEISKNMNSAKSVNSFELAIQKNPNLVVIYEGDSNGKISFDGLKNKISEKDYTSGKGGLVEKYFNSADKTVSELINMYAHEMKENGEAYGESSLYDQIELAGNIGKFRTKAALMDLFIKTYPSSKIINKVRRERQKLNGADFSHSFANVYVGNKFHSISVVDFSPVVENSGTVDLTVGGVVKNGLKKGQSFGKNDEFRVQDILPGRAVIYFNSNNRNGNFKSVTIFEGDMALFDGLQVRVKDVRVHKVAHVSLIPDVQHTTTKADFSFKIGIEKRNIQLSPEKTKEMLKNINKSIVKWQGIVDRLGNVVKGLKGACLATSAMLIIKNTVSGINGASMARQRVMKRYREICDSEHSEMTHTECYNHYAVNISKEVATMTLAYNKVNDEMKSASANNVKDSGGLVGGKSIEDNEKFKEALRKKIGVDKIISVNISGEESVNVPIKDIDSVSQLREVMLCEQVGCDKFDKAERDKSLRNVALQVKQRGDIVLAGKRLKKKYGFSNVNPNKIVMFTAKDTRTAPWEGEFAKNYGISDSNKNSRVEMIYLRRDESYLALLSVPMSDGKMGIEKVYSAETKKWVNPPSETNNIVIYSSSASGECSNGFKDGTATVSYYEYGNNKGLPAIVPFDVDNGWYVMVPNSGGTFLDSSPQGYTASADVNYFKICNVGPNHIMQNGKGDDLCQTFDVNTAGAVKKFIRCPKISQSKVSSLYRKAREAIREASGQYRQKNINIFDKMMKVGKPMSQLSGFECQDFMSPSDCKLLFNVCDPVICPPSRCDLGGRMHVSDVIQTGIIGSIALCLPNAKEGIMIPVCLSGIQAGLDSYLSILKSESSCLQESLKSGEHVGICNEITSIYMCEFFWRGLSPVMDQLLPTMVASVVSPGQRVRGGGEYALVQNAWSTMRKSVSYLKNTYAQNAFKAFNLRNVNDIGGSLCNTFVGTSVPSSAKVLNSLLAPESPTQFYAQFSEILFTEATVPSTSQYQIYYHIYAGKDEGVNYKIYLKDPPASSYYDSTPTVPIKIGYIARGASADETVDITAPSGYKQLCVVINSKEECGFKQVTTNFGLNYIKNKFVENQAEKNDITTEKECISGSASLLSMANLNLQAGAEEIAKPNIALRGIVRVCASANPEASVGDSSNWKDVGYCGDSSMRCWLDTNSVKQNLQSIEKVEGVSNKVLEEDRGLISGGKLTLKAVDAILSSARETIKGLTEQDLKDIDNLDVIKKLDSVIGDDSHAGAGTNGDRAEALALKASVYRLGVIMAEKSETGKVEEPTPFVSKTEKKIIKKSPTSKTNVNEVKTSIAELMKGRSDCDCGDKCSEYAGYIKKYSEENNIDPLRVLAVMIQESKCKYSAHSSYGAYGLMQISRKAFDDICKGKLSSGDDGYFYDITVNPSRTEQNIECGIKILKSKYNEYSNGVKNSWSWKTSPSDGGFSSGVRKCEQTQPKYVGYNGWDAAIRAYNGWGCSSGADVNYVEKVNKIFYELKSRENSGSVSI